jgi:hypothetical protein
MMPLFVSFKKKFIERCIQELIRLEGSKIDTYMVHIQKILIQNLKFKMDNWNSSQPYKKLANMKYTHIQFDDFFKEIEILFDSMLVKFPKKDHEYLKGLQFQLDKLKKLAKSQQIKDEISTKWDWGRGFRLIQDDHSNSAVSLSSPINIGFKTLTSAVKLPSVNAFNINSVLLLASVVILKIRKWKWNH